MRKCARLQSVPLLTQGPRAHFVPRLQIQPPIMPRPDIARLGIRHRRIPVMSIGRDVYLDTRLQLQKLESAFPS